MNFDTPNLIDEDNFSLEDMDNENEMVPLETASSETTEKQKGTNSSSRRRSKCWKNFKIGEKYSDGRNDITCNHCNKTYCLNLRQNGTNTLIRHMRICSKTPGSTPRSSIRKLDMMVFREMIAVALIQHNLPYSFVEYERIREAFAYANPDIEFWSRNTAAADVFKIFEKEKKRLKEILTKIPGRVCLTTDLWRAITIEGYICLTAHYIDVDWILKTKILSFCAFPPPHTGIAIAMKLIELLKDWGLEKKVFSLTVDNASANDSMQGILRRKLQKDLVCNGEFFHIRCSAHILNLIVQDGLAVISEALEKIRDSVKFVKGSQSRENMFQNCMETVGIQDDAGLVLDVTTRWNSTHLMLSRAIKFKDVLRNLAEVEKSYKCFPSDLEWERGESICELLRPFAEMTKLISGSSYPTANTSIITTTTSHTSREIPSGYDGFYSYFSQKSGGSGKSPLDTYLDEPVLDMITFRSLNVVDYWKDNSSRFKELASMACDVLSIPITTVASESSFSIGSRVLNKYRSCLLPTNVQALICARNWFRGFQEIGDEFEFIDGEEKEA